MAQKNFKFVFFGSSRFSEYVLDELKKEDYFPALDIKSAKEDLPVEDLRELGADVFIVASFGKIIPKEILDIPKHGSLNVHPSLLPKYRGPSPIQAQLLDMACRGVGVTIIKMDEKMDHGPILAQEKIPVEPWPDHYEAVEEKLARAGGKLLTSILNLQVLPVGVLQDDSLATYCKFVRKEDGLLDLNSDAESNLRKVLAYSTWPQAYMFFKSKTGREIRVVINDAKIEGGKFIPTRVTPAGKKGMDWQDFLRGNA